ncbi:MAG TPA: RecQ family ATP-dependent DNA helicase [Spirochaetota bacterium]|nr:RecQ family ATP-dependent DNA helicase [Spirochaetota bacterium]HOL57906.1 RecQ family ATP-dependent DNA helicase [Spirochaetota bacterium]HPP05382.1 RecQ family ATP-dependent DNA helicase [Spirochaetota bacterium]
MIKKAKEILNKYFGYSEFRKGQELIINSILQKKDTLGVMPTGGGKSLCYQIPALCFNGLSIVISPLISLMKDQIDFLTSKNYPAGLLNSTITDSYKRKIVKEVEENKIKLLYLTPERFKSQKFLEWLKNFKIEMFVVDEAHCISEWGHDFRPEYRRLKDVINILDNPPILALTATATEEVRNDIINSLGMKKPNVFISGFNRENLIYGVKHCYSKEEKNKVLIEFISKINPPGIIYVASIKECENLYNVLKDNTKRKIGLYHGSMNNESRKKVQEDFLLDKIEILVATNAFGMGVNKQNIRFVVHYSIPGTIEAYYQETGRAGRDGKISYCLLLQFSEDEDIQNFFIEAKNPSIEEIEFVLKNIKEEIKKHRIYSDDYYLLANVSKLNNFKIETILKQLYFMEIIDFEFITKEKIGIKINKNKKIKDEDDFNFIEEIKRIKNDPLLDSFIIETNYLSKRFGYEEKDLKKRLEDLKRKEIIEFDIIKKGKIIKLLKSKLSDQEKEEYRQKVKRKIEFDRLKFSKMIEYSNLTTDCRRGYLLNYFGEKFEEENCGKCDICRGTYSNNIEFKPNTINEKILHFFYLYDGKLGKTKAIKILKGSYDLEPKYKDYDEYGILSKFDIKEIENELTLLLNKKFIRLTTGKYPTIKLTSEGLKELKKNFKIASKESTSGV